MSTQLTIDDLIKQIGHRDLILPEFQRGYEWKPPKVKEYLNSLYRKYPTGSFLIWKTPKPGRVRGGKSRNDGNMFQLILDGQQRLTSVYALITGEPPPFYEGEKLYFNIYFNVKTEEFSFFKASEMKGRIEWIPVTKFFQTGLGPYLQSGGPLTDEERVFLMQFFDPLNCLDSIKSYVYYLDTVAEREMEEVVRIFNLVNKQGTPLSKADLAMSHICAKWPEARQQMRDAQEELAKEGFKFDLNFYVRCASTVATGSALFEPVYRTSMDKIRDAWERSKKALEYLVNILRHDAFIDSSSSLASDVVLVPLVAFLCNSNGKFANDRQKNDFLHWMYLASMWGRYSGSSETSLQQDLEGLKVSNATERLIENIIAQRGRTKVEPRDLVGVSTRTAWSTMAYVVARAAGARDWFSDQPLYSKNVGRSNGLEYHHIFPQDVLYKNGYDSTSPQDRQKVNEIANIAYLTSAANKEVRNRPPSEYLPKVLDRRRDALRQQVVPEQPALWAVERYDDFLATRRQALADAINGFLEGLIAAQARGESTIEDYIAAGESATVEFKGSLRWDFNQNGVNKELEKSVAKTIAAFMNSKGGTLVVGVSDEGEALGIENDMASFTRRRDRDGWEQHLRNVLNDFLSKEVAALVQLTFAEFVEKTVAVLRAEPSTKPIYLAEGQASRFYVRSGNTTQELQVKETVSYIGRHFALAE